MRNPTVNNQPLPFVKWAGGKRAMLPLLRPLVPAAFGTYHEPFAGGGALFFDLRPARAALSDRNAELVAAYEAVRDDVDGVVAELRTHEVAHCKAHFLSVRHQRGHLLSAAARAARLIYLNRTCFNGLYRVNRRGEFNVPFGDYKNPRICDEANLRACSAALQGIAIELDGFHAVLERAQPGDFVYFDPPYMPVSERAAFTSYTRDGFGASDHRHLRDVARELASRDVHVLISNSNAPRVLELYSDGFDILRVQAPRAIGAKSESRGLVEEVVIRPRREEIKQARLICAREVVEMREHGNAAAGCAGPTCASQEREPTSPLRPPSKVRLYVPEAVRHPLSETELHRLVQASRLFEIVRRIVRDGSVSIRPSAWGARWTEIPYQLVVDARRGASRAAREGVPDVSSALDSDCNHIAANIDLPEDLSPDMLEAVHTMPIRPAELNVADYGDRVRAMVKELLATDLARLQADADALWASARDAYEKCVGESRRRATP